MEIMEAGRVAALEKVAELAAVHGGAGPASPRRREHRLHLSRRSCLRGLAGPAGPGFAGPSSALRAASTSFMVQFLRLQTSDGRCH